ncbi:hypothetical protein KCP71_06690 [Salmonella enterica subsp. enterica]|nr:hypothetical protein KCP71_06690 [Salmonella enterica subsp. enterica]
MLLDENNNQPVDMDGEGHQPEQQRVLKTAISALTRKSAGVYAVTVTAGRDARMYASSQRYYTLSSAW